MNHHDLSTASGLRSACEYAEAKGEDEAWREELLNFLGEVRGASVDERATREFQNLIWTNNPVSAVGMGTVGIDPALEDEGFRRWLAESSVRDLPTGPDARAVALTRWYEEIQDHLKGFCERTPHLKIFRVLAAFYPLDFTTLASRSHLQKLSFRMEGSAKVPPVSRHIRIRSRIDDALGPFDPENLEAVVNRLTLPWRLYELTNEADGDSTVMVIRPGEEQLSPLPAPRRRKGLTAIGGAFSQMLSTLEFVRDRPTREELLDYLRAENPTLKDSSVRVTVNSLKSEFGVIRHDGTHYSLTERGDLALESGDPNGLSDWLLTRILGVDHVIHALAISRMTSVEVTDLLQRANPGWTTSFAPNSIMNWLRSFKVVERDAENFYVLTENGQEWAKLIHWEPECLGSDDADEVGIIDPPEDRRVKVPKLEPILERVVAFPREQVSSLHLGLWANDRRHFSILTGLSGSGKTRLAREYAEAVVGEETDLSERLCILPVQPGWYDPTPLFGYVNPLSGSTYESTPFLELLLRAVAHPEDPYFVVLDEMNLSHPEQYLAPILSTMETGTAIQLHTKGEFFDGIPAQIPYPSNLVIIGTVNMDETTMGLSDKVLDRAFTFEFWSIDIDQWPGWGGTNLSSKDEALVRGTLHDLMKALTPARLHFGWRVIEEVVGFIGQPGFVDSGMSMVEGLDRIVYAKVLPKLRGEDAERFRKALEDCEIACNNHGLVLSKAKVRELVDELIAMGNARFWR